MFLRITASAGSALTQALAIASCLASGSFSITCKPATTSRVSAPIFASICERALSFGAPATILASVSSATGAGAILISGISSLPNFAFHTAPFRSACPRASHSSRTCLRSAGSTLFNRASCRSSSCLNIWILISTSDCASGVFAASTNLRRFSSTAACNSALVGVGAVVTGASCLMIGWVMAVGRAGVEPARRRSPDAARGCFRRMGFGSDGDVFDSTRVPSVTASSPTMPASMPAVPRMSLMPPPPGTGRALE